MRATWQGGGSFRPALGHGGGPFQCDMGLLPSCEEARGVVGVRGMPASLPDDAEALFFCPLTKGALFRLLLEAVPGFQKAAVV